MHIWRLARVRLWCGRLLLVVFASVGFAGAGSAQTVWMAPKAPYPPAAISGNPDLMELFRTNAPWARTARSIKVLQLPTQFMAWVPDTQLEIIVQDLKRRGIELAIESLAQNDATEPHCGQGVEGYGHPKEVAAIAAKIKRVGGKLSFLAMDEPLYFGHYYRGPGACHSSVNNVAERVAAVLTEYRKVFPDVLIGDIEPAGAFRIPEWSGDYKQWVAAFRDKVGTQLGFLRADIDWNDAEPKQALADAVALARDNDLKFQIIYNGRDTDNSDDAWIQSAKANIRLSESIIPEAPDTIVFQSWAPHPIYLLPETSSTTLTGLIAWYLRSAEHP